jgi:hypothetical protein
MPPALPKPRKIGGGRSSTGAADTAVNASREEEPFYDLVANEEVAAFEEEDEYDNHLLYEAKGRKKEGVRTLNEVSKTSRVQPPEAPARSAGKSSALFGSLSRTGSEALSSSTDTDGFPGSPSPARKLTAADMDEGEGEEEEETNYVNIQYFLHHTRRSAGGGDGLLSDRQDSIDPFDEEEEEEEEENGDKSDVTTTTTRYSSSSSKESTTDRPQSDASKAKSSSTMEAGEQRIQMCRHILTSILESESIYLECLSVCLQYMKAMKVTLTTPSPVIPKEDFDVIFYKVPELYEFHHHFHDRHGGISLFYVFFCFFLPGLRI